MLERLLGLSFIFGVIFYAAYPGWTQNEVPAYKAEVLLNASDPLCSMFSDRYDEINQNDEMVIQAEVFCVGPEIKKKTRTPVAADTPSGYLD